MKNDMILTMKKLGLFWVEHAVNSQHTNYIFLVQSYQFSNFFVNSFNKLLNLYRNII